MRILGKVLMISGIIAGILLFILAINGITFFVALDTNIKNYGGHALLTELSGVKATFWIAIIFGIAECVLLILCGVSLQEDANLLYNCNASINNLRNQIKGNEQKVIQNGNDGTKVYSTATKIPSIAPPSKDTLCPECHQPYNGDYCYRCGYQNKKR